MTAPDHDPDPGEALEFDADPAATVDDSDPDVYEPQPGDDSYVEAGAEYPVEG